MKYLTEVTIERYFESPFGRQTAGAGNTVGDLVSLLLKISFVIAGIVVLFLFISAGFSIIAGSGRSDPEKTKKGQQAISSAVIGFVLIFVAYWIVRLLEVIIGIPFITNPGF